MNLNSDTCPRGCTDLQSLENCQVDRDPDTVGKHGLSCAEQHTKMHLKHDLRGLFAVQQPKRLAGSMFYTSCCGIVLLGMLWGKAVWSCGAMQLDSEASRSSWIGIYQPFTKQVRQLLAGPCQLRNFPCKLAKHPRDWLC